jgi:hypothetical protein
MVSALSCRHDDVGLFGDQLSVRLSRSCDNEPVEFGHNTVRPLVKFPRSHGQVGSVNYAAWAVMFW